MSIRYSDPFSIPITNDIKYTLFYDPLIKMNVIRDSIMNDKDFFGY